ncbi:YicC/YloC family endoribonuclease [Megasphaera cerevisiae]|jgi:uncharacterized protein (TIGR00255 family)|nr:YicC/YloC family endoribonuclease [Megasphaera cerevisiae]
MTGFGAGTSGSDRLSVTIEMRAVNQRFLELNIRMPHAYLILEEKLRSKIKQTLCRGKVDVFVTVHELVPQAPQIYVDYAALAACKKALDAINEKMFSQDRTTLPMIMELTKDWFVQESPAINLDTSWPIFSEALDDALRGITAMREAEGANIQHDLLLRTGNMETAIDAIAARKQEILIRYEAKLEKKILALCAKAQKIPDEDRFLQEVSMYADKVDFTEEVVRFQSHVLQLKEIVSKDGDIGRKLDFLIQEMNREINTIGSKANDLDITEYVLQLKNELEKLREQVQNIE